MKIIFRSINKIAFFISICFISNSSFAQNKISLDEDWRFHFGNSADPSKDFNYGNVLLFHKSNVYDTTIVNPKFVDTTWTKINVPHDWVVSLPFEKSDTHSMDSHGYKPVGALYPETSIGWYRKHFTIEKSKTNKINHTGTIQIDKNTIKIITKDGYLEVLELQIEGKKRMSNLEFINGYKNFNSKHLL